MNGIAGAGLGFEEPKPGTAVDVVGIFCVFLILRIVKFLLLLYYHSLIKWRFLVTGTGTPLSQTPTP